MNRCISAFALVVALVATIAAADPGADAGGKAGTSVKLETLPAPVKSAVTREASAQEVSSVRQRSEGGKVVYDVEVRRGNKTETICFDEQGKRVEKADAGADAPRQQ